MSCEINLIANCGDLTNIARALFLSEADDWLTKCIVNVSSCGSILAVGYKSRLCILASQWISSTDSTVFLITWSGTVQDDITSLFCAPVCSVGQTSQGGADWICIMVGMNNGCVSFYTNTGHLLLTECLDIKHVVNISCHTGTYGADSDDIHVFYQTSVCILSGTSLFQTLRYAKTQMARLQAGVISDFSLDEKSITFRKWSFVDQDIINDASVVGLELKNTYDHLLSASSFGGYHTWYRSVPPHNTLVMGAGARPYIGFHYAIEGGNSPPLQDVAKAVASKIKSALPGWLGGGSSANNQNAQENKPRAESLSMRSGLCDVQRYGTSVVLSPDKRLAAVTDSLGRVALVDVQRGTIVRLFKGCRDAQCGFIQVFETESRRTMSRVNIKENKRALFLIIYNPKKGLVHIRLMQKGSKVTVFTAAKNGKLIYNCNGLLGTENNYTSKKLNLPAYQCILIDPDGKIKKITIPFHFALEGEHSQRSRDLHLLRKLKHFIRSADYDMTSLETEVINTVKSLNVVEVKRHCIEMLLGNDEITPLLVSRLLDVFITSNDDNDENSRKFHNYLTNLKCLCQFYMNISSLDIQISETMNQDDEIQVDLDKEKRKDMLSLSENEISILQNLLSLTHSNALIDAPLKVKFKQKISTEFKEFVSSFRLDDNKSSKIKLEQNLNHTQTQSIASDCYKNVFDTVNIEITKWQSYVEDSNIDPKDLMRLLLHYWMELPLKSINLHKIEILIQVIYTLYCLSKEENGEWNKISPWWDNVRAIITETPCPLRSMIVAMACGVVCKKIENANQEESWETVTKENAKWSILIGKLEDISLLSAILTFKYVWKGKSLPKLKRENTEISLKSVYTQGKGAVSEMIAKWLCSIGVVPEAILANEIIEIAKIPKIPDKKKSKEQFDEDDEVKQVIEEGDQLYVDENHQLFNWINLMRKQFPHSTTANNIIANMCWEYSVQWQNNKQEILYLESALMCLKHLNDMHLCVGLCSLMWTTHFKPLFEAICKLVNKIGKSPKEVLCLQTFGLNEIIMLEFLDKMNKFFEKYIYFYYKSKSCIKPILKFEKIWDESLPALIEVAQSYDSVNEVILKVVYQIAATMLYQCKFNIKYPKPLNTLFDLDYNVVLSGLTSKDIFTFDVSNKKLNECRRKFLCKLVREICELISYKDETGLPMEYDFNEASMWLDKANSLADMWGIERKFLMQEQVVSMYRLGYDNLAEQTIPLVVEPIKLVTPLVDICGKRLKRYIEHCSDISNSIAALPPELGRHLQSLESDTSISANISLKSTASVLDKVVRLSENSTDGDVQLQQALKLAESMIYGCDILHEIDSID